MIKRQRKKNRNTRARKLEETSFNVNSEARVSCHSFALLIISMPQFGTDEVQGHRSLPRRNAKMRIIWVDVLLILDILFHTHTHIYICMHIYIYIYIYICILSSLRSVGRSNFVEVCINLTALIQKRHILMRTAVLCNGINSGQL